MTPRRSCSPVASRNPGGDPLDIDDLGTRRTPSGSQSRSFRLSLSWALVSKSTRRDITTKEFAASTTARTIPWSAARQVSTMIFVPAESRHVFSVEMAAIDLHELHAAQQRGPNHDA